MKTRPMPNARTMSTRTCRVAVGRAPSRPGPVRDTLAVEEPLEIRIHGAPMAITLRTPGEDPELATGFLYGEGIVRSAADLGRFRQPRDPSHPRRRNVVNIIFAEGHSPDLSRLKRHFYATSSCGMCGKASIDQIRTLARPVRSRLQVTSATLSRLGETMRRAQGIFARTGGLHAAAIFEPDGRLVLLREDVGRHNAVDKAIGALLLKGELPLDRRLLLVSGRASFEILQKAVMARLPVVCAVSAPSSLAVQTARAFGVTLVGFLRGESMNVYTHPRRIAP
ncbi:MAG: formate dehydrogenase accessory sulfurtransferase FdhD [Planctomycetes bacterium]|nr:formate dehydrogenase accessory sulfurtransferase FdhD [Planctomycetota bacterium]